ncbi:hypothetical protein BDZ88DRAFT_432725 [Geranomyces variabilis]|nr:hypothetical protein BDZ88DRAFT_432725 [Geranomyces variabilis]KAJ3140147.1 hypothetical protein HDU90_008371 [Geranomyces variabilis]
MPISATIINRRSRRPSLPVNAISPSPEPPAMMLGAGQLIFADSLTASAAYARQHDSACRPPPPTTTTTTSQRIPKPTNTNTTTRAFRQRVAAFFGRRSSATPASLPSDNENPDAEIPIHGSQQQPAAAQQHLHPNHPFLNSRLFLHILNSTDFLPAYRSTVTLHTAHYPPNYARNDNLVAMLRRKRPRKAGKKVKKVMKAVGRGLGEVCLVLGTGLTGHAAGAAPGWGGGAY